MMKERHQLMDVAVNLDLNYHSNQSNDRSISSNNLLALYRFLKLSSLHSRSISNIYCISWLHSFSCTRINDQSVMFVRYSCCSLFQSPQHPLFDPFLSS